MIGKPEWLAGDLEAHLPVVSVDYHDRKIARLTRERDDLREALTWIRRHIESTEDPNIDKIHTAARHMKLAKAEKEIG